MVRRVSTPPANPGNSAVPFRADQPEPPAARWVHRVAPDRHDDGPGPGVPRGPTAALLQAGGSVFSSCWNWHLEIKLKNAQEIS